VLFKKGDTTFPSSSEEGIGVVFLNVTQTTPDPSLSKSKEGNKVLIFKFLKY
jgi:hypothetical protein